jgi:hypothetical protein
MSKIVYLPDADGFTKNKWAKDVIEDFLANGVRAAVVIETQDEVHTAYWNCGFAERQCLLSHMQFDILLRCIKHGLEHGDD